MSVLENPKTDNHILGKSIRLELLIQKKCSWQHASKALTVDDNEDYKVLLKKHNPIKNEFERRMTQTCKRFQEIEEVHLPTSATRLNQPNTASISSATNSNTATSIHRVGAISMEGLLNELNQSACSDLLYTKNQIIFKRNNILPQKKIIKISLKHGKGINTESDESDRKKGNDFANIELGEWLSKPR
uniref:Uncharacterized protein n=1 Tax=Glossina brevipalpis TaxID=37001 RepID=A0A1A9WW84_9MUSC